MILRASMGIAVVFGLGLGCTYEAVDEAESTVADSTGTDDSTGDGDSTGTDSTGDSTGSETGEGQVCPELADFDKTCTLDSDCAVVEHMINCCGTRVAWGIAATEVATFDAAEAICEAGYPGCGCASEPTVAEDGNPVGEGTLAVACQMGACSSYVLPPP